MTMVAAEEPELAAWTKRLMAVAAERDRNVLIWLQAELGY